MLCVLPSKSSNLYGKSPVLCCGLLHKKDGMGGGRYRITRQGCKDNFLTYGIYRPKKRVIFQPLIVCILSWRKKWKHYSHYCPSQATTHISQYWQRQTADTSPYLSDNEKDQGLKMDVHLFFVTCTK